MAPAIEADIVEGGFAWMERLGFSATEQGRVLRRNIRTEAQLAATKESIEKEPQAADIEQLRKLCDIRRGVENIVGNDPLAVQEFVENLPNERSTKSAAGEDEGKRVSIGYSLKLLLLTGDAHNSDLALEYVVTYRR